MDASETHAMELVRVDATGTEEWHCPTCGRRFQMRWPPNYAKVVLEPGDELATHTGGKGGVAMGSASVLEREPEQPLSTEIADLWRRLLRDLE